MASYHLPSDCPVAAWVIEQRAISGWRYCTLPYCEAIFCGLPELDLAFLRCQPSIQIVRHALFKKVFRVVFQSNKLKRHTGCVSYVFIIMCFGVSICCLNKTKNKDFLGDSVTHASFNIRQTSDASSVHDIVARRIVTPLLDAKTTMKSSVSEKIGFKFRVKLKVEVKQA